MKRIAIMLLLCLLLCGCAPEETMETSDAAIQEETQPVAEPTGSYEADSALESKTRGAVRRYTPRIPDGYAIATVGNNLAVFSGEERTCITLLSGENLYISAQTELDQWLHPEDISVQVTDRGISYFCGQTEEMVLLDTSLKEVARIALPGEPVGTPVLSADRKRVYYCTPESVRVLELESGISRMLLEISYAGQTVEGLLLEDTVIRCRLTDTDGQDTLLFLSAEDGAVLHETRKDVRVSTWKNRYYAMVPEGAMNALIFGTKGSDEEKMLIPRDITADAWFLESRNAVVTAAREEDGSVWVDAYDLTSGLRTATVEMEEDLPLYAVPAETAGQVYLLFAGEGGTVICRWDTAAMACDDETVYTSTRYTRESPDTAGLEECRAYAEALGKLYGIRILLGEEATRVQPGEYTLETEYQVPIIRRDLERLSHLLAAYPERFLSAGADNTASGVIRVALVRSITAAPTTGSRATDLGAHYWAGEEPYIALAAGGFTEYTLYHELYHGMESKLFADSQIFYEWDNLNPESFRYDYHYRDWSDRTDSEYLEGENRAFIDSFSMTFPMEDRARIMEYAMTSGNEEYFRSETMQKKLYQLCLGIRKAFGLTKSEEVYLWEQYLQEHLAYVPKK